MNLDEMLLYLYQKLNYSDDLEVATLTTDGKNEIGLELVTGERYILTLQCTDRQLSVRLNITGDTDTLFFNEKCRIMSNKCRVGQEYVIIVLKLTYCEKVSKIS